MTNDKNSHTTVSSTRNGTSRSVSETERSTATSAEEEDQTSGSSGSADLEVGHVRSRRSRRLLEEITGRSGGSSRSGEAEAASTRACELQLGRPCVKGDRADWSEQSGVDRLGEAIGDATSVSALRDGYAHVAAELNFAQLRNVYSNPDKLRAYVAAKVSEHHGDGEATSTDLEAGTWETSSGAVEGAVREVVDQVEVGLMERVRRAVATRTASRVDQSLEVSRALNRSPESRREFLREIAGRLGDSSQIEKALAEEGIDDEQAASMADDLEASPPRLDRAAEQLEQHLEASIEGLEELETRIENDENNPWHRGRALLTDSIYEKPRRATFDSIGIDPSPDSADEPDDALGRLVERRMERAEFSENVESTASAGLQIGASALATTIGGAVTYAAVATASNSVSIAGADHEVEVTKGAVRAELADLDDLEDAEARRQAAVASAVVDAAIAGVQGAQLYGADEFGATALKQSLAEAVANRATSEGVEAVSNSE